jgi:hypothetical protein
LAGAACYRIVVRFLWGITMAQHSWFEGKISKKQWFFLFNIVTVLCLVASRKLQFDWVSIVSCALALLLINGLALISAKHFPDWK